MPAAEIEVDEVTVRKLIERDVPQWAWESIHFAGSGWDNVTCRLGDHLAVRLPRRAVAVPLLLNEQRWLPELSRRLPLKTPVPVHCGAPGDLFPWPWSVVRWVDGETAQSDPFTSSDAVLLATSLRELHQPAPDEAPVNPYRGVDLSTRDGAIRSWLSFLQGRADISALEAIWRRARDAVPATRRHWIHGDLHPRNIIFCNGSLAGLIDWGDLNGGDVATDIDCCWLAIDASETRREFLDAYGASRDVILRARGWALCIALALVFSGDRGHEALGFATLQRLVDDLN